jgi:endo-1,4-beta-D-glucanase Y
MSAYDGIKFDVMAGASSQGAMDIEIMTAETQPATGQGGGGTATNTAVDENNNRSYIMDGVGTAATHTTTALSTSPQTVYIPFSMLVPRYFPAPSTCGTTKCEAPALVPAHGLGIQISDYPDFSTTGGYDLWVDNVSFYTGDNGLTPPGATMPTFNDGAKGFSHCTRPTFLGGKSAAGKYILWAYNNWKARYVKTYTGSGGGNIVVSPEVNSGSVVSEGIAYGMLIAAYMGDSALFSGLSKYWLSHSATGTLMTWRWSLDGTSSSGSGSATDSDEDAAFAYLEASKTSWGASYASNATTMISDIWSHDIDTASNLPKGGSNYSSIDPTNPSYFAPAYYREFAKVDSAHGWAAVADKTLTVLNTLGASVSSSDYLVPAWCSGTCTAVGSNTGSANPATDGLYQYDAHRVPWRVGLDYCWNGTASAGTYLNKLIGFFSSQASSKGISSIRDVYDLNGTADTTGEPNSMSIVGCAGVGSLSSSSFASFSSSAWQFVLDGENRASLDTVVKTGSTSYSYTYYNATVGLLTLLSMSGNFYAM